MQGRRFIGGYILPKPSTIAASERTLKLAGLPLVNMAGLVIDLMDICYWKAGAVITNIQADLPEGDASIPVWALHNIDGRAISGCSIIVGLLTRKVGVVPINSRNSTPLIPRCFSCSYISVSPLFIQEQNNYG